MDTREKITEEYLLSHGYAFDARETKDLESWWKNEPAYTEGIELKCYRGFDGRIDIKREWTNRYGDEGYNVHVDNQDYESVAWGEFLYVDDLEAFIKATYDDDDFKECVECNIVISRTLDKVETKIVVTKDGCVAAA